MKKPELYQESKMKKIDNDVFIPMPMAVIGSINKDKANFMAAGWNTRVNANPPMIGVGIHKSHLTHDCILQNKSFSLNIPGEKLLVETDYAGLVTGRGTDKSEIFEVFYGENKTAPLIRYAAVSLECTLVQAVDLPTNTFFIGEITGAWCDEDYLSDSGNPDYRKLKCYFLTMPDNSYWSLGRYLGKAWSVGRELSK